MAIRILASGDLHIGKMVSGQPGIADQYSARDTWKRMVDWAINNEVDIVVLTGDIIERDNRFFEAFGPLNEGFKLLKQYGIQVFMVAGNHDFDALPQLVKTCNLDNVHLLGAGGQWEIYNYPKDDPVLQILGWSFPKQYVSQDPLSTLSQLSPDPNYPCLGLLHGEVSTTDSTYAPIHLNRFDLLANQTWILGHIHKPEVFRKNSPYICYPGSPLAFSPKETGMHGPLLISLEAGEIKEPSIAFLSPIRFDTCTIDITGSETKEELRDTLIREIRNKGEQWKLELQDVADLVLDISLSGAYKNISQIKGWTDDMIGTHVDFTNDRTRLSVRKITPNISPIISNLDDLSQEKSAVGLLAKVILAIEKGENNEFLSGLLKDWNRNFANMNTAGIYKPLEKGNISEQQRMEYGKQQILRESKRILGVLLQQKNQ